LSNPRCQRVMMAEGGAYPRSCYICGLGPCSEGAPIPDPPKTKAGDDDNSESIEAAMQTAGRLSSYSDQELFDELLRRNEAIVLLTLSTGEQTDNFCTRWNGGRWQCAGMAQQFASDVMNRHI
jgi:hypothetical protein